VKTYCTYTRIYIVKKLAVIIFPFSVIVSLIVCIHLICVVFSGIIILIEYHVMEVVQNKNDFKLQLLLVWLDHHQQYVIEFTFTCALSISVLYLFLHYTLNRINQQYGMSKAFRN
jgi:hypothetical protein